MSTDNHTERDAHAVANARNWYASMQAQLARHAMATLDEDQEAIRDEITESALSVQVRSGWVDSGADNMGAEEYCVLLSTGGPALRLTGDLNAHGDPETARLEYQDWGTPWTEYGDADRDVLLRFAAHFYFGEG